MRSLLLAWVGYTSAFLAVVNATVSSSTWADETRSLISTSAYVEPNVPTGTPIQGNYTGQYRPQIHFSPPKVSLGRRGVDRCSFCPGFHERSKRLVPGFERHLASVLSMLVPSCPESEILRSPLTLHPDNPTDLVAGNQHWGHSTSPDLYHWTNQPIAIFPPDNNTQVFSGSAVIDKDNTSGFFPDQTDGVVAIYTLNSPEKQVQAIAYSYDGGYTFTPYQHNPVIDSSSTQFRDPKVVWYQDHWVMVLAFAQEFAIGIYTSYDLKYWTPSSNVSHVGILGLQYECPNLVPMPVISNGTPNGEEIWTLFISVNPGAPQGGSITQYLPGSFDGYTFTPYDSAARLTDFAKDNYAGQFFYGTPQGEAVSVAWASNWQYTASVPTAREGWRSAMSLPRQNYISQLGRTGWDLVSIPYDLTPVKGSQLSYDEDFNNKSVIVDYSNSTTGALYFTANFSIPDDAAFEASSSLNFTFTSPGGNESVNGGYWFGGANAGTAWLDRHDTTGYGRQDPFFTDRFSVASAQMARSMWGVIDRTMLEVFIDDGALSSTMLFYPSDPFSNFSISTGGLPEIMGVTLGVWDLSSVWK